MCVLIRCFVRGVFPAGLAAGVFIAAASPHAMSAGAAQTRSGGCGAGKCSSGGGYPCGELGDGCGMYQTCQGTGGDYFCTPQKFCTAAGCSPIDGQVCK